MVEQRKEATVDTSKTIRLLGATAVVSALAILLTSPAQAYVPDEGAGPVTRTIVGNPGGTSWVALELPSAPQTVGNPGDGADVLPAATLPQTVGNPGDGADVLSAQTEAQVATSSGSDGFDTGTFIVIAGGAALVLGAGALLLTARHRRVALP